MALLGKKKKGDAVNETTATNLEDANTSVAAAATPAPPPRSKGKKARNGAVVGINIGNHSIKAVEVTAKNGELSVTGMATVPTPPDAYQNGAILSNTALINALRDLWKAGAFKSRMAIISVAGTTSLIVRVIEVPKMTDSQLSDNMRVDADRYIPFPPSEVIMDFKALRELPSDPDAANMQVLLAAAQREVIDAHVSVVQKAKLDPRAIDVEPLAAVRALQIEKEARGLVNYDEVNALLNVGASGTEITIVRGDAVVFTRTIPNGGSTLTNTIAETLGISIPDAENLKTQRGDALPPAGYVPNQAQAGTDDFDPHAFGTPGADTSFDNDFAAPASSTSDDPFDLDFFNQGPQNNEPGAGHGQKEGEQPKDAFGIDFSFSDSDLPEANKNTGDTQPSSTNASDAPLDFAVEDNQALPAQKAAANPAPAPQSQPVAEPASNDLGGFDLFGDEFSEDLLPAVDASAQTTAPNPPAATTPTASAVPAPQAPEPAAPTSIPSAFDFSDFDLPTVITPEAENTTASSAEPDSFTFGSNEALPTASTQPVTPAPVTPTAPPTPTTPPAAPSFGGFSFDEDALDTNLMPETAPAAPQAAGGFGFTDAPEVNEPTPSTPSAANPNQPAEDDGFDLDALFGKDAGDTLGAPDESTVGENLDVAAAVTADDILPPLLDDADDFSSFGAGLVGGNAADTDEVALYEAMRGPLEELVNEVRRSLEFHLDRQPDAPLSHVYLTGGGAKIKNFDIYLTQTLGVPTTILNPFAHLQVQASKPGSDYANAHTAECAVALGLAVRDFIE